MICPMCGLKIPKVDHELHSKTHEGNVCIETLNEIQNKEMPKNKDELAKFKYTIRSALDACEICIEDYTEGDNLICLPCLHKFHENCILKWAEKSPTCPNCQRNIYKS